MRFVSLLLSLALLSNAATTIQAQAPASPGPDSSAPGISLTIATKQSTYKAGETILVSIVLKNIAGGQYCENHFLETGEAELNGYEVRLVGTNGLILPLISMPRERGMRSRGKLCIDNGATIKESLSLNQHADLTKPGTYQISVNHLDHRNNARILSNVISVTLIP